MRRFSIVLAMVALAFLLAFEAAAQVQIKEAPLTWKEAAIGDGETLYVEICAVCHGMDATGNGPAAPALVAPAPDLTRLALYNDGVFPAARVQKSITGEGMVAAHGSRDMPMWGKAFYDVRPDRKPGQRRGLAQLRILALTEYLETLQILEDPE